MGCRGCPYMVNGFKKKNFVKNVVVKECELMFIGEAPATEEINFKPPTPFVGKCGRLLDKLFSIHSIVRKDVTIANASQCLIPDKAAADLKDALEHCKEHLYNAIRKAKPRLIVCLGEYAQKQVLGLKPGVLSLRGKFYDHPEFGKVLISVHPSYVLRGASKGYPYNPKSQMSARELLPFLDFEKAMTYLGEGKCNGTINTSGYKEMTPEQFVKTFKGVPLIAVDSETTKGPNIRDPECGILSVSASKEEGKSGVLILDRDRRAKIKAIKDVVGDPNTSKVVAARPFDENVCRKLGVEMKGKIFDILTMAHVLDENVIHRVEDLANIHTPLENIKTLSKGMRKTLGDADRETVIEYSGVDPDAELRVFHKLAAQMNADPAVKRYYAHYMMPVQDMLSFVSNNGCWINQIILRKNEAILQDMKDKAEEGALACIPDLIKRRYADDLKLTRNKIIIDYLFTKMGLGLKPKMLTGKTKEPACTEAHMKMFADRDIPFMSYYQDWKKVGKVLKPFVSHLWEALQSDGYIYPSTIVGRAVNGRTVMHEPEIQTYPKYGELARLIREPFAAPKGWILADRDLSQSEIRIMAWLSQDPTMLDTLFKGIDIHYKTAIEILGCTKEDVTKEMRRVAKAVNFGLIYGMSAFGLRLYARDEYDVQMSKEEAEGYRDGYFMTYRNLLPFHNKMVEMGRRLGYVTSPLGRKRRLPAITGDNLEERREAERQAINFPVSSFSNDLGLIGMKLFNDEVRSNVKLRDDVKVLWFIHDAVMFLSKTKKIKLAQAALKDCMETRAPQYIKDKFKITVGYPVLSEGSQGPNWSAMEEVG